MTNSIWGELAALQAKEDLPRTLLDAIFLTKTITHPPEVALALAEAWSAPDFPEQCLCPEVWAILFCESGYIVNGVPAAKPTEPVTLYRGSSEYRKFGMSWTDDLDRAVWYSHRDDLRAPNSGRLWATVVTPDRMLANFTTQSVNEYVIWTDSELVIAELTI